MGQALLTVKNLSAWYSNEKMVLSVFSFELAEQEATGLIGLNGAGKTTFLKVLSGLLPAFCSEGICFCGSPVDFRKQAGELCSAMKASHNACEIKLSGDRCGWYNY